MDDTSPAEVTSQAAPRTTDKTGARRRLDRLVSQARLALAWEHMWPALWAPLGVGLLFLATSWLGLWLELPPTGRKIGLGLFVVGLLASLWWVTRLRPPSRRAALDRVDRDAALGHRPARALEDSLAFGAGDSATRLLWELHVARAERAVATLAVAPPRPDMPRRDPFALRAGLLVATVATLFVAGPEAGRRLGAAFDWRGVVEPAPSFRVDGWIDPPLYTRLPPLMIDLAAGEQQLRTPVGSTVVIRVAGRGDAEITSSPGLAELPSPAAAKPDLREQRYKVSNSADLGVRTGLTGRMRLSIEAIPDRVPEIALTSPPETNSRGGFTLAYKAKDDYGLASAEAFFDKSDGVPRRSLVPAPRVTLALPTDPRNGEETKTAADLSTHPWAGARVKLTLVGRDEAEQEGRSAVVDFTLPQRAFTKPLARALVEQRRNLVLNPDQRAPIQTALDALLIAPERFTPEWGVFLGLRTAAERLRRAKTDTELTDLAEWLWAMALQIEEGDLSQADRELRAAQDRLREAIERGAPDEEIRKLTEELRLAMDKFLREFAQRMERDRQQNGEQAARGQERTVSQDDLNRMLNEMQDAMRRGDVAEAQRLLDQLRNILDNLRTARPGERSSDPMAREMNRQMEELGDMAREQQQLRDESFKQGQQRGQGQRQGARPGQRGQEGQRGQKGQRGQGQRGQGQRGQQGQDGQGSEQAEGEGQEGSGEGSGLGRRQQALRERLQDMQRRMRGMGMRGEQGLGEAEGAMREAEGALGQGQAGQAVDPQGRALEALQRGMQGMAQQMQQMMGQNEGGEGEGDPFGPGNPQGRAQNDPRNDDPLGRPTRSRDFSDGRVRVPGANESGMERARRILEELRRKLGDPLRPREELDYFERLLRRN